MLDRMIAEHFRYHLINVYDSNSLPMQTWFRKERQMTELPEGLWDKEDENADGFISWNEFKGPKGPNPDSSSEEL